MQPDLKFFSVSRILAMSSSKVGGKGYMILECWDKSRISENYFSHPSPHIFSGRSRGSFSKTHPGNWQK